jgi:hypothetical protein
MNSKLRDLLPAIVSRVIERGSFVTKTKLLKLLYLFDIEWYRGHEETFTGFDWIFLHLGPWTPEFDDVLDKYVANEFLKKKRFKDEYDTELITTDETIRLDKLFDSRDDERLLEELVKTWARVPTEEILDHVYFRTEPMEKAARKERLDFSKVSKQPPRKYRRTQSGLSKEKLNKIRENVARRLDKVREGERTLTAFTPPEYNEEFYDAMERLERVR